MEKGVSEVEKTLVTGRLLETADLELSVYPVESEAVETLVPRPLSLTWTITDKVEWARRNRNKVRDLARTVRATHRSALSAQMEYRARSFCRRPVSEVLDELAGMGLAWRDIARVVGVSVPAVRRWRQGESAKPEHRQAVARFAALVGTLGDSGVADVATWLEVPIDPGAPITGLDLASERKYEDLCELAEDQVTGADLLDEQSPDWRNRYRREYELFRATDGELGLRPVVQDEPDGNTDK